MSTIPRSYLVIAIAAVIWNLLGVMAFFSQVMMSEEALAALPAEEQALLASSPGWLNVVFAVAVFAGLLGSIGLLLKKVWCVPLFLLSLLAVAVQMLYSNLMTEAPAVYGIIAVIMSIITVVIAAYLLYYSRQAREKSWLT